jgi:hypothetical protein
VKLFLLIALPLALVVGRFEYALRCGVRDG